VSPIVVIEFVAAKQLALRMTMRTNQQVRAGKPAKARMNPCSWASSRSA
jgi:hypothetical protein